MLVGRKDGRFVEGGEKRDCWFGSVCEGESPCLTTINRIDDDATPQFFRTANSCGFLIGKHVNFRPRPIRSVNLIHCL